MENLLLNLGERSYSVTVGAGLLSEADKYFNLGRKVFIVTDTGVPREYARLVAACAAEARIFTVREGEGAKSPEVLTELLSAMLEFGLTRSDCAVSVGGGVVGDLTGFAAAIYMRGIDFYNVPTTLLSQVDSSIGGKCAVNFGGVKNIVGAFHQPRGVLIDTDTLKTLPKRQLSNGLAEVVKMALTSDKELFELLENQDEYDIEKIIVRSLMIKKQVVEADEHEGGLRKILNFGHTFGHTVEAVSDGNLYHGECVAIGMTVTSSAAVKERLLPVLQRLGLPTAYGGDIEPALMLVSHDKKCDGNELSVVLVDEIGSCKCVKMSVDEFCDLVRVRAAE